MSDAVPRPDPLSALPPRLNGFLRAVCALSNGAYSEGGMSCVGDAPDTAPPALPPNPRSNDAVLEHFFAVALGEYACNTRSVPDHLVQELRRVLREDTGGELTDVLVEDDPGGCWSELTFWWQAGPRFSCLTLFWSLD